MACTLGCDLGGTNTVVGVVDTHLAVLSKVKAPTVPTRGPEEVLDNIVQMALAALAQAGFPLSKTQGIGIGVPGLTDPKRGVMRVAANFPGWKEVPVASILMEKLGIPAFLDNDERVIARGERARGAAQGVANFLSITIGTGIGMAISIDGKIYPGDSHHAGELGHTTVIPRGRRCYCGNHGCLEAHASAPAIVRRVREEIQAGRATVLREEALDARAVFDAAQQGDALARQVVRETGELLGIAIANAVQMLDPALVIIGGGVAEAGETLLGVLRWTVAQRAFSFDARRIVPSPLGDDAGVIGAAALVYEKLGEK